MGPSLELEKTRLGKRAKRRRGPTLATAKSCESSHASPVGFLGQPPCGFRRSAQGNSPRTTLPRFMQPGEEIFLRGAPQRTGSWPRHRAGTRYQRWTTLLQQQSPISNGHNPRFFCMELYSAWPNGGISWRMRNCIYCCTPSHGYHPGTEKSSGLNREGVPHEVGPSLELEKMRLGKRAKRRR